MGDNLLVMLAGVLLSLGFGYVAPIPVLQVEGQLLDVVSAELVVSSWGIN